MDNSKSDINNQKKDPFEDLTREELIKKCKQFLGIAQRAKQAKDDLVEENKELSKKLKDTDNKSQSDIKTLQEMVNVLTQQKLQLVTDYDILLKQKQICDNHIKNYRDELIEVKTTRESLETQLHCYRRQVSRLTEENEDLISHLNSNEKEINDLNQLNELQKEQLLSFEKERKENTIEDIPQITDKTEGEIETENLRVQCVQLQSHLREYVETINEKSKMLECLNDEINSLKLKTEEIPELQKLYQIKTNESESLINTVTELQSMINSLKQDISGKDDYICTLTSKNENLLSELESTNNKLIDSDSNCANLLIELEDTKKTKQMYNEKLKCYHAKLVKVFADVRDLKQCKVNLLLIIDDYCNYIHKWQNDIKVVSCKYNEEIEQCNSKIQFLEIENTGLKHTCELLKNELSQVRENTNNENDVLIQQHCELQNKLKENENIILKLTTDNDYLIKSVCEFKTQVEQLVHVNMEVVLKTLDEHLTGLNDKIVFMNTKLLEDKCTLFKKIESREEHVATLEEEKKELLKTLVETNKDIEGAKEVRLQLLNLKQEREELVKVIENNNKCNNKLSLEASNRLNDLIANVYSELHNVQEIKDITEVENNKNIEKLKLAEEKLQSLSMDYTLLEEKYKRHTNQCTELTASNQILENIKVQLLKEIERKSNETTSLSIEKENLLKEIDNYKNKFKTGISKDVLIDTLNEKIDEIGNDISLYEKKCSDLKNQLTICKRENAELLKEMNDMNEALKERGETISKQQEYSQDLLRRLQCMEQDMYAYKQNRDELEEENRQLKSQAVEQDETASREQAALLKDKNERIKQLEQEMQQFRDSITSNLGRESQDGGCGDSETMSTSTMSRSDEAARLRDLEGSWEERYTKLRNLAIKQKGKIKELTEQLSQERNEKSDIQNKLSSTGRNLQSVQNEYDNIRDQHELLTEANKINVKQIEILTAENNNLKQELKLTSENMTKTVTEVENLKKEKSNFEIVTKQFTTQIHNLKKEIENNATSKKELESKVGKLENLLSLKEEELQREIKIHDSSKEQLLKYDKEIKKNSVLSLEMEDYERSLKELSLKLEKKNETVSELQEKLSKHESVIASMKGEISVLEENLVSGERFALELENELFKGKTKISEYEAIISQKDNRIREIIRSLEELKSSNEEINEQMSHKIIQSQKEIERLRTEKDYYKSQILGLEEKARELVTTLKDKEQELLHLQTEYSNYKVRAQSVLRQNQTRDVAVEERLCEEVGELESQVETLTTQLTQVTSQLESVRKQYELAENEKLEHVSHCSELEMLLLKEKTENKNLVARQHQLVEEHREALRSQKIHTETLAQCYKQQLAEQEDRHIKELAELRAARSTSSHGHTHDHISQMQDVPADTTPMQRRESDSMPISLDKLLSMDVDNISTVDYESELSACKKHLSEYEAKVKHLTDLLADAEQDLAKHAQLNQLLKEDIRRHQRSVEREKHAENLEYLKNVVFKFLTLHNGDEKSRLVPVLNTILKLSPEETQKLNSVAKGADTSLRGWGSYLPLWNSNNQ